MARPLRLEFPGALYHLTARGNARQEIYLSDADRRGFLSLFGAVCERFGWRCHGYCMMSNHYHLIVETAEANLSRGMRQLNGVYTQAFNRAHGRVGHLFQGRYKAILVDRDAYLLELARYVALNPVRAGLVARAEDWPWSGHRALAGLAATPDWLETDWLGAQLAGQGEDPRAAWRRFVAEGEPAAGGGVRRIWDDLRQQLFLGGEAFVEDMQARLPRTGQAAAASAEVPRAQRRPPPRPLAWYAEAFSSSGEAMARAWLSGDFSQATVARHFGVHYSTVSRAARRFLDENGG